MFPLVVLECGRTGALDGAFCFFKMSPFLGVIHKFLVTGLTLIPSYSAMTEPVRVIVSFVLVLVRTINTLVDSAIMSFGMPGEIAFIEKSLPTFWVHTEETWLGAV